MQMIRRSLIVFGLIMIVPVSAWARPCDEFHDAADNKRHDAPEQMLEARELLIKCVREAQCNPATHAECETWLSEVNEELPTVVLQADVRSPDSQESTAIQPDSVTIDGRSVTDPRELAGSISIPLNPGEHNFVFVRAGYDPVPISRLIRRSKGSQGTPIKATFEPRAIIKPAPPPPPPPSSAAPQEPASTLSASTNDQDIRTSDGSPLKTIGYVASVAGLVGLGVGVGFGIKAVADKSSANCGVRYCDPEPLADARSSATVSTVGLITGGVLLAGGVALILLSPGSSRQSGRKEIRLAPAVSQNQAGFLLRASW